MQKGLAIAVATGLIFLAHTVSAQNTGASSPGYVGTGGYACTMQYDPVCGARQVQCIKAPCYPQYETFGNSCVMAGEGATFIHKGECYPHETGPVYPAPQPTPVPDPSPAPFTPPLGCVSWYDGCNSCSRNANGQTFCTLRACYQGQDTRGYCTSYSTSKPPVVSDPDTPVSSGEPADTPTTTLPVVADDAVEKSAPPIISFVSRLWSAILSFFGW